MRHLLAATMLVLFAGAAGAQDLPARYAVEGVAADDVLNVRERPDAGAPVVDTLAPDAQGVEVLEVSPDGRWALVSRPEGSGWAALRYLEREAEAPGPLPRPLRCLGTEPFWSLRVDAEGAVFETPEGGAIPLRQHGEAGGFTGAVAAFDAGGETLDLTVVRQQCSDGMSDRPYGLTALVWNRGEIFLEGCCTVSAR